MYTDVFSRTEIVSLIANSHISNNYNQTEIYDIGNDLSTLISNTYNKHKTNTSFTYYYNIGHLNTQFGSKANSLNTYTKSEVDNITTLLGISSMLNIINNNDTSITNILDTRYTKSEVDTIIYIIG